MSTPSSHSHDHTVSLGGPALQNASTYRFPPGDSKPCIHPLTTPNGRVISGFQMSDHVWHRALWFTIKFVDEDNFREKDLTEGTKNLSLRYMVSPVDQRWHPEQLQAERAFAEGVWA